MPCHFETTATKLEIYGSLEMYDINYSLVILVDKMIKQIVASSSSEYG